METIQYNDNLKVVSANALLKGKQSMKFKEAQILLITIAQVDSLSVNTDFTYTTSVTELAKYMKISEDNLYRDLYDICKALCKRLVEIRVGNGVGKDAEWKIFQWVSSAEYKNGTLKIRLSDDLKPYLTDLKTNFSQPFLADLMTFKSYYAIRLYLYLFADWNDSRRNKTEWKFTIREIREMFQLDSKENAKKYKLARDLLKKTILPALTEIGNSNFAVISDIQEIKGHGRGTPLVGIKFKAVLFENKEDKDKYLHPDLDQLIGQIDFDTLPKAEEYGGIAPEITSKTYGDHLAGYKKLYEKIYSQELPDKYLVKYSELVDTIKEHLETHHNLRFNTEQTIKIIYTAEKAGIPAENLPNLVYKCCNIMSQQQTPIRSKFSYLKKTVSSQAPAYLDELRENISSYTELTEEKPEIDLF